MFDIEKARRKGVDDKTISLLESINANTRKQESCLSHDFHHGGKEHNYKWICKNCGCKEDAGFVRGYQQGLIHGGVKNA